MGCSTALPESSALATPPLKRPPFIPTLSPFRCGQLCAAPQDPIPALGDGSPRFPDAVGAWYEYDEGTAILPMSDDPPAKDIPPTGYTIRFDGTLAAPGAVQLFCERPNLPRELVPTTAFVDAWGRFLSNEGRPADW